MLPRGYRTIIDWFQEVGLDPDYANPALESFDESDDEDQKPLEGGVELNRFEEIKDDEETEVEDGKTKVGEETKVEDTKDKENKKPVEETA